MGQGSSYCIRKAKTDLYDPTVLDISVPHLNVFSLDGEIMVCFLVHVVYSNIFSSVPHNSFIRKPIDNEDLLKRINEVIIEDTAVSASSK
jgi:hypothetical protein